MRFWDSSALVPLLVREAQSASVSEELRLDLEMIVWWASRVECVSAIARAERDGLLDPAQVMQALARLDELEMAWSEIQPTDRLRAQASRLLRVHALRAADSLQLAAALVAAEDDPKTLDLMTLDERLALAAQREGFTVRPNAGRVS